MTEESHAPAPRVFYSWQSDLAAKTNRTLIEDALKRALKEIQSDLSCRIELDQDSRGAPGSPDIPAVIFEKIRDSAAVVCDVSIVSAHGSKRPSPNPNVLVELGYAFGVLGPERVISVLNEEYGAINDLPFDIGRRRVVTYRMSTDDAPANARRELAAKLATQLKPILAEPRGAFAQIEETEMRKLFADRRDEFLDHLRTIEQGGNTAVLGMRATLVPTQELQIDYRVSDANTESACTPVAARVKDVDCTMELPSWNTIRRPRPQIRGVTQELIRDQELSHQFHVFENGVVDTWWIDQIPDESLFPEWIVAFVVSACRMARAVLAPARTAVDYQLEVELFLPKSGASLSLYKLYRWAAASELPMQLLLPPYYLSVAAIDEVLPRVLADVFNAASVEAPPLQVFVDQEVQADP